MMTMTTIRTLCALRFALSNLLASFFFSFLHSWLVHLALLFLRLSLYQSDRPRPPPSLYFCLHILIPIFFPQSPPPSCPVLPHLSRRCLFLPVLSSSSRSSASLLPCPPGSFSGSTTRPLLSRQGTHAARPPAPTPVASSSSTGP